MIARALPEDRLSQNAELRHALFDTAIGRCGIAWTSRGIVRVRLPEADEGRATRRLPGTAAPPPEPVAETIRRIVLHLQGQSQDFTNIQLDLRGIGDFPRRVYAAARGIAPGCTATYGEIAVAAGFPGEARAVGRALGANPFPLIVPCHRVVAAGAGLGGFSAPGGAITKTKLLALEGVGLPLVWS